MYRKRTKGCKNLERMRQARIRQIEEGSCPDYPPVFVPPKIRRKVIVIDYDMGEIEQVFYLLRTSRIDTYKIKSDGKTWSQNMGWSKFIETMRKGFIRIGRIE